MRCFRFVAICLSVLLWSVQVAKTLLADDAASPAKPKPTTFFPGTVFGVLRQIDGSAVCGTTEGVFLAVDNLRRWSAIPSLPREHPFHPVGGDRNRFYVEDLLGDSTRQFGKNSHLIIFGDDYSLPAVRIESQPYGELV